MKDYDKDVLTLASNPATPDWAKVLIATLMAKDPVDAANTLDVLTAAFEKRAKGIRCEIEALYAELTTKPDNQRMPTQWGYAEEPASALDDTMRAAINDKRRSTPFVNR